MACGYMFYGTRISNIIFLEFSGFQPGIIKDCGRQYKCHNISDVSSKCKVMLMILVRLVNNDIRLFALELD